MSAVPEHVTDAVLVSGGPSNRFRTTFVTLSRNAGASDRDIMAATNHADERMLSYYDKDARKIERSSCAVNVLAAFVERAG